MLSPTVCLKLLGITADLELWTHRPSIFTDNIEFVEDNWILLHAVAELVREDGGILSRGSMNIAVRSPTSHSYRQLTQEQEAFTRFTLTIAVLFLGKFPL